MLEKSAPPSIVVDELYRVVHLSDNAGRFLQPPGGPLTGSTLWREAQVLVGDGGLVVDVADPLELIERVMRYFFSLGVHGAKSKAPVDQVQNCFQKALHAASLAAPYRHARLSAVKHLEQADSIDGVSANATPEELRAEIAKRIVMLAEKGYVDLEALPRPAHVNEEGAIADEEDQKGSD
jgi:hypothetical protein